MKTLLEILNEQEQIHLQNVGKVNAIKYGNLKPGMKIMFNYGVIYIVKNIKDKTPNTVIVTLEDEKTKKEYTIERRKNTSIGLAESTEKELDDENDDKPKIKLSQDVDFISDDDIKY